MILYIDADVNEIFRMGKEYPWKKPEYCTRKGCNSFRLWGHGYVGRYFDRVPGLVLIKRYRCPECGTVYTFRPLAYWERFRATKLTVLLCLVARIREERWRRGISPKRQACWYRGLRWQSIRHLDSGRVSEERIRALLSKGVIPSSHSTQSEVMRC